MIPTALEKDAFPALASALTFESKSTQKSTFSRKERSDDCFYSVQVGSPRPLLRNTELSRKYPRYCGSPKMNIFKRRNETMMATTPHQGGPADCLLIWALSEIPPILGFTKNDTFSNKDTFVWLVLGCINDFLNFVFSSGRRASKYHPRASPERQIQPKKQFSAGGENRGRRARALESL